MAILPGATSPDYFARRLSWTDHGAIDLVAERMRLTLVEILGAEIGTAMYSMDWLRDRVRWHLDPQECTGAVFVLQAENAILGHAIVRVEPEQGPTTGLFSTIYVEPCSRRRGLAHALIRCGETWLASQEMTTFGISTGDRNYPLIALFERHGYSVVLTVPESQMVHLSKTVAGMPR